MQLGKSSKSMHYQETGHYNNLTTDNKIWASRAKLRLATCDRDTHESLNTITPNILIDLEFNGYMPYMLFVKEHYLSAPTVNMFMLVELKYPPC